MGALSRSFGRQVDTLNLTPVPKLIIGIFPVVLLIFLLLIAYRIGALARTSFREASLADTGQDLSSAINDSENLLLANEYILFTSEIRYWSDDITRWSNQHSLPPALVALVMQIESCGAPHVISSAGAAGLFQVMPFHFSAEENPIDPEDNAARGLSYLARAYELADGSIALTLAGYNGGHSKIDSDPSTWAEETRRYVTWGTGIWEDIQAHEHRSETLAEWLAAGGSSLCLQARNSLSLQ